MAAVASELLDQVPELHNTVADFAIEANSDGRIGIAREMVNEVAKPRVGEALLFAPSAIVGLNLNVDANRGMKKLGAGFLKIRVRARVS